MNGEVDTLTAPRLESVLDEVLDTARRSRAAAGRRSTVVVDLSGVVFLSSSGLATLIRGARRASAADVPLRLVAATRAVVRPLAITGADALFDIDTDLASALAASWPDRAQPAPTDVAPPAVGGER